MKRVLVEWVDAIYLNEYYNENKTYEASVCEQVGFLVRRDRNVVILSAQHFDDGDKRHIHVIPKGCVKSIKELTIRDEG